MDFVVIGAGIVGLSAILIVAREPMRALAMSMGFAAVLCGAFTVGTAVTRALQPLHTVSAALHGVR